MLWLPRGAAAAPIIDLGVVDVMITLPRSPAAGSAHARAARFTTHQGRTGRLLSVTGRINAANANQLSGQVHHALWGEWLVLDLTAVEFIDTAGMETLHAINDRCARFDVHWSLVAGPAVSRILSNRDLPVSESLTAALASVQRRADGRATTDGVAGDRY